MAEKPAIRDAVPRAEDARHYLVAQRFTCDVGVLSLAKHAVDLLPNTSKLVFSGVRWGGLTLRQLSPRAVYKYFQELLGGIEGSAWLCGR